MLTFHYYFHKIFSHVLIISVITTMGIVNGNAAAQGQNISNEDITNFADAVLQMESDRQQAYDKIKQIIGAPPPNIPCNDLNSLSNLPEEARTIAADYCRICKEIVEDSGLTVERFNAIMSNLEAEPNLVKRIQNAMLQLQRQ